jgi:DNA invertase Pin-like site-specific DNA recombinase
LVELFDTHGVSFVSITQQFNTTTSMGWLTLNVLLSFAQFEREVTSERIRDTVAASKRKGLWVGGMVPLGYELKGGRLLIVEETRLPSVFSDSSLRPSRLRTTPAKKPRTECSGARYKARLGSAP